MEHSMMKKDFSLQQIKLHKEKIRDKYQVLLLKKDVDSYALLNEYKQEILDFASSVSSVTDDQLFALPPINHKHTTAISIDREYLGLDLVSVLEMAAKTMDSENIDFNIENDVAILKRMTQNFINQNNQKAESLLFRREMKLDEIMVSYATKEQEIVDLYRLLILKYQNAVQTSLSHSVYNISLYFDNYFVDFEENLKHIEKGTIATEHPYYLKMFRTTQDKLNAIYSVYLDNVREFKLHYIEDERAYTELHYETEKYTLEYNILLSEFEKYATLFLNALDADNREFERMTVDHEELTERFKQV